MVALPPLKLLPLLARRGLASTSSTAMRRFPSHGIPPNVWSFIPLLKLSPLLALRGLTTTSIAATRAFRHPPRPLGLQRLKPRPSCLDPLNAHKCGGVIHHPPEVHLHKYTWQYRRIDASTRRRVGASTRLRVDASTLSGVLQT